MTSAQRNEENVYWELPFSEAKAAQGEVTVILMVTASLCLSKALNLSALCHSPTSWKSLPPHSHIFLVYCHVFHGAVKSLKDLALVLPVEGWHSG